MTWLKWLPWRYLVRELAQAHGFLDPINLISGLQRFAQPSEVEQPVELLRAGALFHARGLINSRVIQNNLDWIWPYWIERQFDPSDPSFIPRAFSLTHVNLTHRNWTAAGHPACPALPIVDPRGLLTPLFDSWSLDGWVIQDDGNSLFPSYTGDTSQTLALTPGPEIITQSTLGELSLNSRIIVEIVDGIPVCRMTLQALSPHDGWLVAALRPYNPEGISFIHRIELLPQCNGWLVDDQAIISFSESAEHYPMSSYRYGDVANKLIGSMDTIQIECDSGMASAAALFRIQAGQPRTVCLKVPLPEDRHKSAARESWPDSLAGICRLVIPDRHFQFLYDAGLRTLILHSVEDIYPGPYTYKRFWFRDAAFILQALLCAGLSGIVETALDRFPGRQTAAGYFHSQDGEWDSNGEALFILNRFCEITGRPPKKSWWPAIVSGARWIARKRLKNQEPSAHYGLLPAGFSAEHLGPNDFYYWDDFWGIAGLQSAAALAQRTGDYAAKTEFATEAANFRKDLDRSLAVAAQRIGSQAMPASPYRRQDAGAIGSLAGGYPLQLLEADDDRLGATAEFLMENCFYKGGFFQDMIHSGINAYLTLHIAQILLRAGDARYRDLMHAVAAMASPTGQWPEAIHPRTGGGCMGDGQHVWAAAEWIMMLRNCFVREEDDALVIGAGVFPAWLSTNEPLSFGPAPTAFGVISLTFNLEQTNQGGSVIADWQADWHKNAPLLKFRLPDFIAYDAGSEETQVRTARVAP